MDIEPLAPILPPLPEGAALVVNGGFFDREGAPEGLLWIEGAERSPYRRTLGGGVLWIASEGDAGQLDGETFVALPPEVRFAVQSRPRLVVASRNNIRSDNGRRAARTALCLRERSIEVWVAFGEPRGREDEGPTLYELGQRMAAEGCREALNLDGGPSTAFADGRARRAPQGPLRQALVFRGEVSR